MDDKLRVETIRYTLEQIVQRNLGFIVYGLHYSNLADLHNPKDGPCGDPGNLAFINKDGNIRPGHEIFNGFCV